MQQIEYTRTVVPSTMRSPYWKYFGFPSDNGNNILTRQKIVCTICNTAIAYNKNTSNLRTHLMSKHVEIFKNIITPSNAMINPKLDKQCYQNNEEQVYSGSDLSSKRKYHEADNTPHHTHDKKQCDKNSLTLNEYNTFNPEYIIKKANNTNVLENKVDLDSQSAEYIAYLPSNESEIGDEDETTSKLFITSSIGCENNDVAYTYNDIDSPDEHDQQIHSMDIMLADLIQTDLLPLNMLEDYGFCKFNQQLAGIKINAEMLERVKILIETRFTNMKQNVNSFLSRLSQSQAYSLSFEIYKDNEGQDILNIYFNYLNYKKMDLTSILLASSAIRFKAVNISEFLADINLKNCSGVVVTCLDNMTEFISDFAKLHEFPLIECLESMLTRCLDKIFKETEFYADYEKFLKIILESKNDIHLKKSNFRPRSKWSIFNFLEYIFQNVEENELEQWVELRRSFEYLKPLKMALDIIMDEPLPLCSLSRPLIKKMFEQHYSSLNQRETRLSKVQKILENELYERIIGQKIFSEVSFFDTRFHRDFALQDSLSDINNFKTQIVKRYKHIIQLSYINDTNNINMEKNSVDSLLNIRKSSLKTFFKRDVPLTNTADIIDLKTNLDLEFEQYYVQPCLDLEQSPVLWWQQQSENYKQLSKIAKSYLTIPCCCVPRLCRIDWDQRQAKLDRRKNLSQFCATERKLWYLYYNKDVSELF